MKHRHLNALVAAIALLPVLGMLLPAAGPPAAFAAPASYVIDPAHSSIGFRIRHFVSKVSGQFNTFEGTIVYDAANPAASSVKVTIDPTSIDTNNGKRDEHLRSPDFFDVATFPAMTFTSSTVTMKNSQLEIQGDLTMHGVTKQVTLACEAAGTMLDPGGNTRAGFSATTTLNRKDFGIVWNKTLDQGGMMLGDEVEVMIEIQAVHQAPKAEG